MSHSRSNQKPRARLAKLVDKYAGWLGEKYNTAKARKFFKRLTTKHNRRVLNTIQKEEIGT